MKHVQLNNIAHKNLKIITARSKALGDNIGSTITVPTEFAQVQGHYPIFFRKDASTGEFQSVVMFGFENGENLFLNDNGWDADYIPIAISREPFLIGFQNQKHNGSVEKTPVIHIDMDNPRVNESEGEPVFLEQGASSPYLERICKLMEALHVGLEQSKNMFTVYQDLELIEPLTIDVTLDDGSSHKLAGYYTINEEKLATLDGKSLELLHKQSLLFPAFMVVASTTRIGALVNRKNALIAQASKC